MAGPDQNQPAERQHNAEEEEKCPRSEDGKHFWMFPPNQGKVCRNCGFVEPGSK